MEITGFAHFNLRAPRALLDELLLFYTEVIGLEQGWRPTFPRFGYWLYIGSQNVLHLTEATGDHGQVTSVPASFDHASFRCAGIKAFEQKLTQQGVEFATSLVPQTNQVQLFFKDPAGNGVELSFSASEAAQ